MELPPIKEQPPNTEVSVSQSVRDTTGINAKTPHTEMAKLIYQFGFITVASAVFIGGFVWFAASIVSDNRQGNLDRKEEALRAEMLRKEEAARVEKMMERSEDRREKQREHDELRTQTWFKAIQERHTEDGNKTRAVLVDILKAQESAARVLEKIAASKGM